ncbi:MAG: UDP-2,4-diacetamido-2,4,6-trideoxy-beta-L-altropyranose hydrolase [Planctomycetes bacterium]|nr:UDP-2,4-diacetamido-2,4,6-trideoxy-beta-L-altropyranose hydrolase [Planctomycetota bacterium]
MSNGLVIRADASSSMGVGHLVRSLALAQAWTDAGRQAVMATAGDPRRWDALVAGQGIEMLGTEREPGSAEDAKETIDLARSRGAAWVAVDGYHFGHDYQRAVRDAGLRLLAIDDYGHADRYEADIVLNQNVYADESYYTDREPTTRLLLGTRYALLRRPFAAYRDWRREIPAVARRVLVTLGGGAADRVMTTVIEALAQADIEGLEAKVVVGASAERLAKLGPAAERSGGKVRLVQAADEMPQLMAEADVAVSAGGSTSWELAYMGLPTVAVVLSDNQRPVVRRLARDGVVEDLGSPSGLTGRSIAATLVSLMRSLERRREMSCRGRRLVDGLGAARVVDHMAGPLLSIRLAGEDDCEAVWRLSNDPLVRAQSFSSEPIPWERHVGWYAAKLRDPGYVFYVALDGHGRVIGQVRYETGDDEAVVSVSLDESSRGQGYAGRLIELASGRVLTDGRAETIHAYVKRDNERSARAFLRAGYREVEPLTYHGSPSRHLVMTKDGGR